MYPAVDAYPKPRNLLYMIEMEEPETAIVFCNTRNDTSLVAAVLNRNGYDAELLNGDLPQKERERVMAKVKRGEVRFMVATDIAARGIDISDLSHVINYSLPEDPAVFLHRVGRTGRIGKKGTSLSIVSGAEIHTLTALQKKFGIAFEEQEAPDARGGAAALDRSARGGAEGGDERVHLRGVHPALAGAQEPPGRRVPRRVRAQVLLHSSPHGAGAGPREGGAQARGARAPREGRGRARGPARGRGRDRAAPQASASATGPRESARPARPPSAREASSPAGARAPRAMRRRRRPREREVRPSRAEAREGRVAAWARRAPARAAGRGGAPAAARGIGRGDVAAPADVCRARERGGASAAARRIFLSLGEQDGADEARVRELVAALAPGVEPRAVEVRRTHAFVEVAPEGIEGAVQALHGKEWSGKTLTAERARGRRR